MFCGTDARAIGNLISRELLRVIGAHKKYLKEAPELQKIIPARKPCVTDVLCNCEINSEIINVGDHFGHPSIYVKKKGA